VFVSFGLLSSFWAVSFLFIVQYALQKVISAEDSSLLACCVMSVGK
jgi:hypothetical protein